VNIPCKESVTIADMVVNFVSWVVIGSHCRCCNL